MASRRIQRLNEQLKREISGILRADVHDPRIGVVTVTGVETSPDLMFARVHVRPLGTVKDDPERETDEVMEGLAAAAPYVRRELGKILHIRRIPELHFQRDETLEQAMRIESILDDVRPEGGWEQTGDEGGDEAEAGEPEGPAASGDGGDRPGEGRE